MVELTKDTIKSFIENNQTVFIQLSADWCPPCKRLKSRIPDIQKGFENVSFGYVDIDSMEDYAKSLNVLAVPTIAIYSNGKLVKTQPTSDENVIRTMLIEAQKS